MLTWLLVVPFCFVVPYWAKAWGGWARLGTLLEQTDARVLRGLGAILVSGVTLSLLETGWLRLVIFMCLFAGLGAVLGYILMANQEVLSSISDLDALLCIGHGKALLSTGNQKDPSSADKLGEPPRKKYRNPFWTSLFLDAAMLLAWVKGGSKEDHHGWAGAYQGARVIPTLYGLPSPRSGKQRAGPRLRLGRASAKKFRPHLRLVQFGGRGGQQFVAGEAWVDFRPQQQLGSVHIAFWPPFAAVPQVRFRCDDRARVKLGKVYPFGMRLDVRLFSPAHTAKKIRVHFRALGRGQEKTRI
ncbi:MAG: hypothetical protein ACUVQG_12495 [Thermogutta sp.]